jgi:8-oxo-dGTP pyrophosphatase MutT (NUDIX family)
MSFPSASGDPPPTRASPLDDPQPWQVLSRRYLFRKPPWLVLREDHVRLPMGGEFPEYWVSEFPDWVNVVAVTPADEVVLVRQYRHGLGAVHYELPAGVVEDTDASAEDAARRELLAETGYGGGRWTKLLTLSPNPGLQTNFTHCFLAEGVDVVADPEPEPTEDLRLHLWPIAGVLSLIEAGELVQALMVAPLLAYLLKRRRRVLEEGPASSGRRGGAGSATGSTPLGAGGEPR